MSERRCPDNTVVIWSIYIVLLAMFTFTVSRDVIREERGTASIQYAAWSHARGDQ